MKEKKTIFYYLCSPYLTNEVRTILNGLGGEGFGIPECPRLARPVAAHPDMLFSIMPDGTVWTDGKYFFENKAFFESLPFYDRIKPSVTELAPDYPMDIAFDCVYINDIVIGKGQYLACEIKNSAARVIDVKQGYALCSTLKTEKFAITADKYIYNAIMDNNCEVLFISSDNILLNGYNCGFIGGASCVVESEKTVVFFGNVEDHPDFFKMKEFIEKFGYVLRYPKNVPLEDFGGVKIIKK